jgi:uncharacterized protein (DUF1800 family)
VARTAPLNEHLYRRAGFGLSSNERKQFGSSYSYRQIVDSLLVYDAAATDVDGSIGLPGYLGTTANRNFRPNNNADHARQRWLFRMVHTPAPIQERMALVWHNHFATARSKIAGVYGGQDSTRLMAAKPSTDVTNHKGQIELFREFALGNFKDLLVEVAKDPAMLVWLDGRTNFKAFPQENFGRELMELFTFGVEHYTEEDVYAAARVFTGWNLRRVRGSGQGTASYDFFYNASQHDTDPKDFSFPIYPSGANPHRIPGRSAAGGMQDGLDLIEALAFHPETARRMARRLWTWFVSETQPAPDDFVQSIAKVYLDSGTNMRTVMRAVLTSSHFQDPQTYFQRYAWPVEFVVRSFKEVGFVGFSAANALAPLTSMGQQLLEPPDVNGWSLGPAWFSTAGMLSRTNFASLLATNQRVELRNGANGFRESPQTLVDFAYDTLTLPQPPTPQTYNPVIDYVQAGGPWTGSDTQLLAKAAGVFHLLSGSGEYQFI